MARASTATPNVQFYMDEIRLANTWQDAVALSLQDTQAPSTPTNLTATAISPSAIALAWSAATDNVGVAGYHVFRGGSNIANVSATSYTDQGLTASTLYSYTVDTLPDDNWSQCAALGAAAKCLTAESARWIADEFGYSLNGVSLDLEKSGKYQGLGQQYNEEFKQWMVPLTATRAHSVGLRQLPFLR